MQELLVTPLDSLHHKLGAKMVSFAGYSMPIQYKKGIIYEHTHTREKASIFDVSHMGQIILTGKNIAQSLEKVLPIDVIGLKTARQRYGFFTLENGGILDDLMLTRIDDETFYLVANASRKAAVTEHLKKHLPEIEQTQLTKHALIALQGPKAAKALEAIIPDVKNMIFMDSHTFPLYDDVVRISRSGYTGEDGFEISIPATHATHFCEQLLENDDVEMAGLGARDSLRLESGLCLYGNDIDETTTPVSADLLWGIQKVRRQDGERQGGFIGADKIFNEIKVKPAKKRVGFTVNGKIPVRPQTNIIDESGNTVGIITSGGFGSTVGFPIAMGYVDRELSETGQKLFAEVRKNKIEITVAKLPLVPQNYYRG